jgi:hypothetical protein
MYRTFFTATLLFLFTQSEAQRVVDVASGDGTGATDKTGRGAVTGQLYTGIKYVRLTAGSPFFKEQFMNAVLFDDAGSRYHCNAVRLNLLDNEINFLGDDGKENTATAHMRSVVLTDSVSGTKYSFVMGHELSPTDRALENQWFQVLVNDETSLCRQIKKKIHETPAYGTATTDEDIVTIDAFYLHRNGTLVAVKGWDDLQNQLQDQKALLTQYIKDHHLKGRSADDYTQVVTAYNSAKKP